MDYRLTSSSRKSSWKSVESALAKRLANARWPSRFGHLMTLDDDDDRDDDHRRRHADRRGDDKREMISVLMPVRDAMPHLPSAVMSVLTQRGVTLELVVADDGSSDGSSEWLRELERAFERSHGDDDDVRRKRRKMDESECGTRAKKERTKESWDAAFAEASDPSVVASVASASCEFVFVRVARANTPSGQGLALNACYARSRGAYVGEMEADDVRPANAFATLKRALEENPSWDASTSRIDLIGVDRRGMKRFQEWQNEQTTPREMRDGRFIEIPAMRASGLYRRSALERLMALEGSSRVYRDLWKIGDVVVDCAASDAGEPSPRSAEYQWWPVDSDFWHRWFFHRFVVGKVPEKLYVWRQYDAQSTKTHSRCSLEQLRRCKAHFFVREILRERPVVRAVRVYGVGSTLDAWSRAIEDELAHQTSHDTGADITYAVPSVTATNHVPGCAPWTAEDASPSVAHVFVFGMSKPRRKVAAAIERTFKTKSSPFGDFRAFFVA